VLNRSLPQNTQKLVAMDIMNPKNAGEQEKRWKRRRKIITLSHGR
jgi:hypothetical protein